MSLRMILLSACALLFLAACDMPGRDRTPDIRGVPSTLRAYTVPPERAEQMRIALIQVLGKKGSAALAAPDKILVLAPTILQSSVAETIALLVKDVPRPVAEAGPVKLQVWVVDVSENPEPDPRLLQLAPTLEAIRESLGAPGFQLHAQLAIRASFNPLVSPSRQAGDDRARMEARLSPADNGVFAELNLAVGPMQVETQTQLKFGETVVLAQASPTEEGRSRVRLVLIRADPAG